MFTQATFAKTYDGINNSTFQVVIQFDGEEVEYYFRRENIITAPSKFDEFGTYGFYKKDVIWAAQCGDFFKLTKITDKFAHAEQVRQGYRMP